MDGENWSFSPGGTPKQVKGDPAVERPHPAPIPPPPPAQTPGAIASVQAPRITYPQTTQIPRPTNGMATASLVLGVLGFFIPLLSILALIFGPIGISKANQGASGKGLAVAGLVLGILGTLAMFYAASNKMP